MFLLFNISKMSSNKVPVVVCSIVTFSAFFLYLLNKWLGRLDFMVQPPQDYSWIAHGIKNILGYMTILIPGYLAYRYIKKVNYLCTEEDSFCHQILHVCFNGEDPNAIIHTNLSSLQRTTSQETLLILFHFFGLQISYLTWGVLQEKVMTQDYYDKAGHKETFTDSQFLVFVNRVLACCMSGLYLFYRKFTRHRCPLYKYTFCSLSNIMSSWCQYEALKYVSFPHQVLAKSAKTIPVMIMGRFVSKIKYEYYEYVTSVILSVGMLLFLLDTDNDRSNSAITTFSGALLLILYITFDSFTSNWQGDLFKTYHMKPVQMMCFVNLFSCILTSVSLLQQDGFLKSFYFMTNHPEFVVDCIVLSVCSATGQLFIFSTISKFGPLTFAVMTTVRQGFSILLSCIIYKHQINAAGVCGICLVFLSVFLKIYCNHRHKKLKKSITTKSQRISV